MKFKWDKKYLYWGVTALLVIVASSCFFIGLYNFRTIAGAVGFVFYVIRPVVYGLIFAYLMNPIMNFIEKRVIRKVLEKRGKKTKTGRWIRVAGLSVTVLIVLLILAALIYMIVPQIIASVKKIIDSLPMYFDNLREWSDRLLEDHPDMAQSMDQAFTTLYQYLQNWFSNDFIARIDQYISSITTSLWSVVVTLKDLLIGFIISAYILYSKEPFLGQAKKILYAVLPIKRCNSFLTTLRETHKVFGGFFIGKILDSAIIGVLCFIGMTVFGLPYALLVSAIVGVTNIVPFFGPFIGAIPSAFLILMVDPLQCLYFIIFIIVLQQFDGNILGPRILGNATGLSGFWVIFAILVGGGFFGFAGMVVGVPLFAVVYIALKRRIHKSLSNKQLPTGTSAYINLQRVEENTKELIPLEEEPQERSKIKINWRSFWKRKKTPSRKK